MTTATGAADDDEVLTTEVEREPGDERIAPRTARILFLSLAAVAALALLAAILAIVLSDRLSPASLNAWLFGALGVLLVVIVAEVVLLLLARPRKA